MANKGGQAFLEKVSRLYSRQDGKPVHKATRKLVLNDWVANRKESKQKVTCVTEMSIVMACWKKNSFMDNPCSSEIQSFYTCVHKAQKKSLKDGVQMSKGRLPPNEAQVLLRRFPNPVSEI